MANKTVPARVAWAVEQLAVSADDHILEIGCGRGVAVSLICPRLTMGTITAIDRSASMIAIAEKENSENIASGTASFRNIAVEDAEFPERQFTKIFAVNVNLFWVRSPERELALFTRLLTSDGALYLFYEPPTAGKADELAVRLDQTLAEHGFSAQVLRKPNTPLLRVLARPTTDTIPV